MSPKNYETIAFYPKPFFPLCFGMARPQRPFSFACPLPIPSPLLPHKKLSGLLSPINWPFINQFGLYQLWQYFLRAISQSFGPNPTVSIMVIGRQFLKRNCSAFFGISLIIPVFGSLKTSLLVCVVDRGYNVISLQNVCGNTTQTVFFLAPYTFQCLQTL